LATPAQTDVVRARETRRVTPSTRVRAEGVIRPTDRARQLFA
jgi:hypothetical protein